MSTAVETPEVLTSWPAWAVATAGLVEWDWPQAALRLLPPLVPGCAADPEAWFSPGWPSRTAEVVECCQACPVLAECRTYAVAARERDDVWGGTPPADPGYGRSK